MSQTQNTHDTPSTGVNRGHVALSRMMRQGRSWSGRERNCAFLNTRDGRFATVSAISGFDSLSDSRAIALTDWDHDGDVDVWISARNAPRIRFLRNETSAKQRAARSVSLRLIGNGKTSPRTPLGARVQVFFTAGKPSVQTLRAGDGFLSQSSRWLHFGAGTSPSVERVVVRWPGTDEPSTYRDLAIGGRYRLRQGSNRAEAWAPEASATEPETERPVANRASDATSNSRRRIPLIPLVRIPESFFAQVAKQAPKFDSATRRPVLVNLWASWCAPCRTELNEFSESAAELRNAGLDVVALSVDGLGDDRSDPATADRVLKKLQFPWANGRASEGIVRQLQDLHDGLVPLHERLPVPSTFLIDRERRLSVIYKGRTDVAEVLRDLNHSNLDRAARIRAAARLPGTLVGHDLVSDASRRSEVAMRFQFALALEKQGRASDAMAQYEDIADIEPEFAQARINLAILLTQAGNYQAAERHAKAAVASSPDLAAVHFNYGVVLEALGRDQDAFRAYAEALRRDAKFPRANNSMGILHAKHGAMQAAARSFAAEIQLFPNFADA
ncbi:MAG: ASPIC/UnbV domain-containing protein, partial [Planctomycetota bacterium]